MSIPKVETFLFQKVNSILAIVLICVMAFWTVLFYVSNKAEAIITNNTETSLLHGLDFN